MADLATLVLRLSSKCEIEPSKEGGEPSYDMNLVVEHLEDATGQTLAPIAQAIPISGVAKKVADQFVTGTRFKCPIQG